ncbi:hypothetical protein HELRODRAFT_194881 [Helobdella robusta]|uniref:C-type lectin domain-containing protein n=1 Tax=Helobdella robusta TaxID=6412 RepID=T1FWJ0_HELRO|nr:hypothetical protein HELRODRAFT_194881 [Helobdella robusta]ESO11201.1 hypothetical protein HELRODRAFT_194881 [Helobdella robusta]
MNFLSILEVFVFIQNTFVDSAYVEHYYESMGATLYSNGSEVMVQSYEEASEHCQTTGGKMLKILNSDQQSDLNNFLNNSKLNVNRNNVVFIGFRRSDFEQNHKLHSILKPEEHGMSTWLLSNYQILDYVELEQSSDNNFLIIEDYKLKLMSGNKPNRFLCSKSECYENVESEKTWYDARSYCLQKGEDLITFNKKFDASKLKLKINKDKAYWLGYSKISWYWEDEPDVFTKFTNWRRNSETTFYGDEKKCSAMSIDDVSRKAVGSCTSAAKNHYVICMKEAPKSKTQTVNKLCDSYFTEPFYHTLETDPMKPPSTQPIHRIPALPFTDSRKSILLTGVSYSSEDPYSTIGNEMVTYTSAKKNKCKAEFKKAFTNAPTNASTTTTLAIDTTAATATVNTAVTTAAASIATTAAVTTDVAGVARGENNTMMGKSTDAMLDIHINSVNDVYIIYSV